MKSICLTIAVLLTAALSPAAIPISGRPVPTMNAFDSAVTQFMEQWNVEAAVVGIMRENRVVYLRGFGSMDAGVNMPENAMVRQASATKPATAAAIRMLAADGVLGAQGLERRAFRISTNGVSNNGLINVTPFPSLGDARLADITVRHLLEHKGGFFPRNAAEAGGPGDPVFRARDIAADMGVPSPPSRTNVIRWMLGQALRHDPGDNYEYSNFGYLVLGEIIQQVSGMSYVNFLHERVFTPEMWVPQSELEGGLTERISRNAREPWYRGGGDGPSVFDNTDPVEEVDVNYGGQFNMPMLMAHGGLIASAPTMLALGNHYCLDYPDIGQLNPPDSENHGGALRGMQTELYRRSDGTVLFIFINKRWVNDLNGDQVPIADLKTTINDLINAGPGNHWSWPDASSDGVWVQMTDRALPDGLGGYNSPWTGFGDAVTKAQPNTRLRLKAGDSNWTGTINKRLRLDAPLGLVRLGIPE
ncbi:MAG TPA: serine hydrolase domain-containing protein [Verrucomicrobiales bacterium]|nr:serine hydrolase domain-containing protein [Verrucomicrobiales bacterium]